MTRIRKPVTREVEQTKTEFERVKAEEARPEHTIEERLGANRIMGYIGGGLCLFVLLTIVYPMVENSKTIPVDGTVVSILSESNSSSSRNSSDQTEYWHVFRFTDLQGVERTSRSVGWLGRNSSHRVGSVVSIGYYEDDFSKVRDYSWFGFWGLQLFFLIPGVALIAFSMVVVKQIKEEQRAEIGEVAAQTDSNS